MNPYLSIYDWEYLFLGSIIYRYYPGLKTFTMPYRAGRSTV